MHNELEFLDKANPSTPIADAANSRAPVILKPAEWVASLIASKSVELLSTERSKRRYPKYVSSGGESSSSKRVGEGADGRLRHSPVKSAWLWDKPSRLVCLAISATSFSLL